MAKRPCIGSGTKGTCPHGHLTERTRCDYCERIHANQQQQQDG